MKNDLSNNLAVLKSIINDAIDAIFVFDSKGKIILVNKSARRLTRYSKKELLNMNMRSLFSKASIKEYSFDLADLTGNKIEKIEREICRKDGKIITVEMNSKKLPAGYFQSFMRDITEQKKINKDIHDLNLRYKTLFDFSPVGIVIEDKNGKIIDANPAIHKIFGYKPGSLIGKNINIFAHKASRKSIKQNIKKILNGQPLHHTLLSVKADGTSIFNELYETKIAIPGFGDGVLSISKDITKQVIAENKLKDNERLFRNIIEHSTNLFYMHDSKNKLTYVSPQARSFLDCSPEEALVEWTSFLTDNPKNKIGISKARKAFKTGLSQGPYELELKTKKGRVITVEVNESPVVLDGKTKMIIGALTDITSRRIKENELEKSHKRYKELFDYSPIPILEEDVTELFNFFDQLKQARIRNIRKFFDENPSKIEECVYKITPLKINKSGLELYGFENIEEYIVNFRNIFTQKSLKIFKEQLIAFFNGKKYFSAETETVTVKGEHKYLIMTIQLLPKTNLGRTIALFSLIDTTKQKTIEQELTETKNQFKFAIEGSGFAIWDWNISENKVYHNQRFAEILGIKSKTNFLRFKSWKEFIHPEDRKTLQEKLEQHLTGESESYNQTMRQKHESGKWIWTHLRGKVVAWDENNKPTRMIGTLIDITSRKIAEEMLKTSEERFRILFEHAAVPIWIEDFSSLKARLTELRNSGVVDFNKYFKDHPDEVLNLASKVRVIDVNQKSVEFYKAKDKDSLVKELPSYFTNESLKVFEREIIALANGASSFEDEIPIVTPNGKKLFLHINLSIPPIYQQTFEQVFVSFIDITDSKRTTELLKQYLQELETLFSFSKDLISNLNTQEIIHNIPQQIVRASVNIDSSSMWKFNHSKKVFEVVSWAGYEEREISGLTLSQSNTIIGEIYKTGKPIICNNTEKDLRYGKFSKVNTKATIGVPLIYEDQILYVLFADNFHKTDVFAEDDLKLLQSFTNIATVSINNATLYKKIKESEERYRSIFDSVGESIFVHDAKNGKIIDVNKKMLETFGFSYDEALKLTPEDSSSGIPPYTAENAVKLVKKVFSEGPQTFEWHSKKKNGKLFWTEVSLRSAIIGGVERVIAVVRDIDERKKIEQAIAESEAKIDTIMRSAPVGIGLLKNDIIEYANDNFIDLTGYGKKEIIGKELSQFYESIEQFRKDIKHFSELKTKQIISYETNFKTKNNSLIDVLFNVSPIDQNDFKKGFIFSVLDITENKKTQEMYLHEQLRYKNLFEHAPIPLWEEDFTDLQNKFEELRRAGITNFEKYLDDNPEDIFQFISLPKILNVNQATLNLHKAKNKEKLYEGLSNIFTEKSITIFKKELVAIFNGQKYFSAHGEVKTLDGEIRIVDLRLYLEFDSINEDGRYKALLATIDITEQKKAEEELRASEFNLKEAQRIAQIGNWELDVSNGNMYWSDEMYRIFELSPQKTETILQTYLEHVCADDFESVKLAFESAIKNSKTFKITHQINPDNDRSKFVSVIGRPIINDGNRAMKFVGTVQDVTDRILAEKEIREHLERNKTILETINDGFILADDKGKILDVNPAYCRMSGYSANELKNMDIREVEISFPKEEVDRRIKQMVSKGYDVFETKHKTKNGKIIDLSVSIAIINQDNNIFVAAFVRDITIQNEALRNLKKSEEQIRELAQYLQEIREDERRNIAREIHDDLGQSLTALKLDTSILLNKIKNNQPGIEEKLRAMKDLTDQTIRSVQKISSELRPGILDDLGLIPALDWELKKFGERTNIECEINIHGREIELSDNINITVFRVFQEAFTNIARHAKATEVSVNIQYNRTKFFMSIKDNGIGITQEQINSSKAFGIMGMRERLQKINGTLKFTSNINVGTEIIIEIPISTGDKR